VAPESPVAFEAEAAPESENELDQILSELKPRKNILQNAMQEDIHRDNKALSNFLEKAGDLSDIEAQLENRRQQLK
jgi:hypothetical protein